MLSHSHIPYPPRPHPRHSLALSSVPVLGSSSLPFSVFRFLPLALSLFFASFFPRHRGFSKHHRLPKDALFRPRNKPNLSSLRPTISPWRCMISPTASCLSFPSPNSALGRFPLFRAMCLPSALSPPMCPPGGGGGEGEGHRRGRYIRTSHPFHPPSLQRRTSRNLDMLSSVSHSAAISYTRLCIFYLSLTEED